MPVSLMSARTTGRPRIHFENLSMLQIKNLHAAIDSKPILSGISLEGSVG